MITKRHRGQLCGGNIFSTLQFYWKLSFPHSSNYFYKLELCLISIKLGEIVWVNKWENTWTNYNTKPTVEGKLDPPMENY